MCSPAIALLAVTAVSSYSQIKQGQDQQDINNAQASAVDDQAQRANEAGSIAEQSHRGKVQKIIGSQTAAAGASGADVASGSFGDVMDETAVFGEMDAQTIRMNALRESWGLKTQAQGLRYQGKAAKAQGMSNALGTALTGFGSAYGMKTQAGGWMK